MRRPPQPPSVTYERTQDNPLTDDRFVVKEIRGGHLSPATLDRLAVINLTLRFNALRYGHFFLQSLGSDYERAEEQARQVSNPNNPAKIYAEGERIKNLPQASGTRLFHVEYQDQSCEPAAGPAAYIWTRRYPNPANQPASATIDVVQSSNMYDRFCRQHLGWMCLHAATLLAFDRTETLNLYVASNNTPLIAELETYGLDTVGVIPRPFLYGQDHDNTENHMRGSMDVFAGSLVASYPWLEEAITT